MITFLFYPLLGILTGFLAGFLGLGGGFIIVPALYTLFVYQSFPADSVMHMALGSSLAIVGVNALFSAFTHHHAQAVVWHVLRLWIPALSLGAVSGSILADYLHTDHLRLLFGILIFFAAWRVAHHSRGALKRKVPSLFKQSYVTFLIGLFSAIVGIGGGSLLIPFALSCHLKMKEVIGTTAACSFPIALFGTIGFMVLGAGKENALPWSSGYVYWPAVAGVLITSIFLVQFGAKLAHRVPSLWIQRALVVLLLLIGLRMVVPFFV
ncbi:MAG: sulfite exporter TauE/SafE family protein [Gammaproteobacteria bacterium]|nr:sulfite exporter TauE/SafE family protein [Gammaproteobacteria bacterium]